MLSHFQSLVYSSLPTMIAVSETWLCPHIYNNELLPSGYNNFRSDRPTRGGSVLFALISHYPVTLVHSQSDPDIVTVKLLFPSPIPVADPEKIKGGFHIN